MTEAEIARMLKISGFPRGPGGKVLIDLEKIREFREMGWGPRQIGEYFGVSGMTIRRRLVEMAELETLQEDGGKPILKTASPAPAPKAKLGALAKYLASTSKASKPGPEDGEGSA